MERVSNLHAHIYSPAGVELGVVAAIWDWNYTEVLDGAGEWHLECWATLANETLLAEARRVDLYGTLEGVERALSSGPISGIEPTMNLGGSTFYVTGQDRIAELATRIIPALNISERGWARMVAPDTVVRGRMRWLSLGSDCKYHDRDRPEMCDNDAGDPTLPDLTTFQRCMLQQPKWSDSCKRLLYQYLYVGFDTRFDHTYLDFETPNTSETGGLQGQYYSSERGWTDLADLVDGTQSGSYTFAQSGEIAWTIPEDWERTTPTEAAGNWFWIRFFKAGYTPTDDIEIRDARVYTDVPTTNALNLIMAYAPTTWQQSGYGATDEPAYDVITGMTVLAALGRLREQIGGHFRAELVGGLMQLQWFTSFSASGIVASGLQQPDETHVRLIKLVPKTDLTEFITRVYPIAENATLADTTRELSAPYELDLAAGFIRNTDAEAAYGRRERMVEFEVASAAPEDSFFYHPVLTANTLCDVALEWLKQHDTVAQFYSVSATGFREMFAPGYTIGLDSEATVQGDKTIDIDTTVNVVSVRSTFDRAGFLAADLEVTTIERRAMTGARVVAEAIGRQGRSGSIKAIVGGGDAQTLGGYPAGAFARVTEPTIITANWQFRVSPAQGAGDASLEIGCQPIPHISFKVETDSGALEELLRLGDLLGNWGYTGDAEQFGLAIGKYAANLPNITLDLVNGFRLRLYETMLLQAKPDGTASIAGWDLNAASLSKAGATLHSSGYLSLGTENDIARLDAAHATYRLWIGHATAGSAPFRVTKGGALTASAATITGNITATSGTLGTLAVTGVLTLEANAAIRSNNYASGYAGWQVDYLGRAEFANAVIRGELHTALWVRDLISVHAGTDYIAKSGGTLSNDMVVPGSGTWYVYLNDPPAGGFLLDNSDICRVTSEYSAGIATIWFTVSVRTDMGDGRQRYTCTYNSGTRSITYPAGAAVVDYGVSGQGILRMTAESALHGPHYSVATHAGAPWTTMTERVRLGNLNGTAGIGSDIYGLFAGDYANHNYMLYQAEGDPAFQIKAGGGAVSIDDDGITLDVGAAGVNFLKWHEGALVKGRMWANVYAAPVRSYIAVEVLSGTGDLQFGLHSDSTNNKSYAELFEQDIVGTVFQGLSLGASGPPSAMLHVYGSGIFTQGLNIGTRTGATPGDVWGSGEVRMTGTGDHYVMGDLGIRRSPAAGYALDVTAAGDAQVRISSGASDYYSPILEFHRGYSNLGWRFNMEVNDFMYIDYWTGSAWSNKFRIDTAGRFGINCAPGNRFAVKDDAADNSVGYFWNDGNNANRWGIRVDCGDDAGVFCSTVGCHDGDGGWHGGLGIYNATVELTQASDRRRKTNLVPVTVLDRLRRVDVMEFSWIDKAPGARVMGYIAQQMMPYFPDIARHEKAQDRWSVAVTGMIPVNTRAIQEVDAEVVAIKAAIVELQKKLERMERRG